MVDNFFPYGAQYYRTPNPPDTDWERDLKEMKAQGMNTVRLWAMWSWIHASEDQFDFSHLERLMDICERVKLKALVQVILENAPAWLVAKHPEAQYVANDGQKIWPMGRPNTPGGGWPGLCLDNKVSREAAGRFMTELARHFCGNETLLGYDVWNEVWFELDGYIGSQYYCYCPGTIAKFKSYLKSKYGDLKSLNRAWYRRYSSWNEVLPPRYWGGYPDWLDWIKFRLANQGELLRWRVQTLRNADPAALLVSHGLPTTIGSMATHLTDDWRNAKEVDIYGLSCFPLWFHYDSIETFKVHDMLRGACDGKRFWTAETQAGPSGEGLMHSRTPDPKEIRLWNWTSLASGAKGVLYWQWRPELLGPESPGFGLCHLDGTPTERTRMASHFANLTSASSDLQFSEPVKGQIAIAVLPESQIFCYCADKNAGKYAQSVRGAYKAFSQAGFQVDFAKADQLEGYPLVYLPMPLMIESESASKLIDYVKNGGYLISEACPAQFGDGGYVRVPTPGYGLDKVFGVRAQSGPETVLDNPPAIMWNGRQIGCVMHRQMLTVNKAAVLGEYSDGGPALTENFFGEGRAVLIGTYAGLSLEWGCMDAGAMLVDLAAYLGLTPIAHTASPDVWVRLHRNNSGLMAYVVNLSDQPREVTVHLSYDAGTFVGGSDPLAGEEIPVDSNSFNIALDGHDGRIVSLVQSSVSCISSLAGHFSGRS